MKGATVQINWHDTKPVLTCDFHPVSGLLATGGADYDIKLWSTVPNEDEKKGPGVVYQNSLSYHGSAVNVLRFSPKGDRLASGADGGELIFWNSYSIDGADVWKVLKTSNFHRKDVLDLEWSTDGAYLISGSVDNQCIIWDAIKCNPLQVLDAHHHYVQGVAWDPLGKYAASLSSDRTCRIYMKKPSKTKGADKTNYVCQHVIAKAEQKNSDKAKPSKLNLFHDETLPSFFRRLAWSPDGAFIVVPAGSHQSTPNSEPVNTAYIFARKDLSRPAFMLPCASKPIIAVRFCPKTFKLRGSNTSPFFKLPYRLIFAVATLNSVYIYDTESIQPIVIVAGVHYAAVTDITWSPTGNHLALSSQDGYCSIFEFGDEELGSPMPLTEESKSIVDEATQSESNNAGEKKEENPQQIKDEKQALPATEINPSSNKPAKRRITPMAID